MALSVVESPSQRLAPSTSEEGLAAQCQADEDGSVEVELNHPSECRDKPPQTTLQTDNLSEIQSADLSEFSGL